jgi:SAM-dependent methyltransferase
MTESAAPQRLEDWMTTPLGEYLLERERNYFDEAVADIFGYNAFQLGMPEIDLLRASRITLRCHLGVNGPVDVHTDFRDLPIASNSADLILLPHVLEFADHPHQILREVERVLMPEGQVVLSGFNPYSLWGMRRKFHRGHDYPWDGRFISLMRVKDWLALLGFELVGGQMGCYAPPSRQQKWLERFHFMETAGDRWWPIGGGVYFLQAVKKVRGMRLIMPKWSDRLAPVKCLAASAQKIGEQEEVLTRSHDRQ